jgi:lipoprotein-releasing system permease protein
MPFAPFEWMLAIRYLRARRSEGFISIIAWFSLLGIGLGVATLIIVMSVMNGFRAELLGRIIGVNGHLTVQSAQGRDLRDFDPMVERLRKMDGVVSAAPIVEGQVMATANGVATGAQVRGMRGEDLARDSLVSKSLAGGSMADFAGDDAVIIGYRLAAKLGLLVGDSITLISPQMTSTAFGSVPRSRAYRVAGTFDVGMFEYDSTFVFMPFEAAQVYFRVNGAATGIEVKLREAEAAPAMRGAIFRELGNGVRLYDWQQANAQFFNALQVERNVMFLILTLIILVAAFNIISSLIMLVKDKGRDIAILRTMGATRGAIMRVFFIAGTSVGVIGTLFGFLLGIGFTSNIESIRQWLQGLTGTTLFDPTIYFLSKLPAKVDPTEVIAVVAMSFVLCILATIYPSWRAARLDPVEALRYE